MNNMITMRMLLSIAALAAVAVVFAAGANAKMVDDGGSGGGAPAVTTVQPGTIPYLSHGIGVDESQFATPTSPGFTGVHAGIESRVFWSGATGDALKVDRAVAAANEAYDLYVKQLPAYPAHVDMMNQLRNLTEQNAIKWGWSQGLAHDQASAGKTQSSDVA